jgi:UDP-glucose 4-epimerase
VNPFAAAARHGDKTMPILAGGKFVVVGGASLLGSHIGEQLLAAGAREVVLLDNLALGSTDNIRALLEDRRCTFVRADILRLNELFDPLADADGVFNVAGFLTAPIVANPWLGLDVNVRGAQNVLEACRYQGVKKLVFSSTTGVYGMPGAAPNTEASPLDWDGMPPGLILYCSSKIMGEGLGRLYEQRHGIAFLALRYSAVYGERQHRRALDATRIVEAHARIRAGERPVIEGDGTQVQDYVYVGDVAHANLLGMASDVSGEPINIVSGIDTSQSRIVELVAEACGSAIRPEYRDAPAGVRMPAIYRLGYDRRAAKRLLGWEPEVTIEQGMRKLVAWLDQERAADGGPPSA